jgi:phosphatidylserine/phosphatidylglycerophosphate/cardiolipin synthase-like enzyme
MLRSHFRFLSALALFAALVSCKPQAQTVPQQGTISVYFSPHGGCTDAIVEAIAQAQKTLDVQAYSFTSAAIAEAVAQAHARGVKVRAVLDKSQKSERYTSATYLRNHSVPVYIDDAHSIAHNKVMIIDGSTLITGSFNFTKAAEEHNAENLLIIRGNGTLAASYAANFESHLSHSKPYVP